MFDYCRMSGVEHSDATVVQLQNQPPGRVNADAVAAERLLVILNGYLLAEGKIRELSEKKERLLEGIKDSLVMADDAAVGSVILGLLFYKKMCYIKQTFGGYEIRGMRNEFNGVLQYEF